MDTRAPPVIDFSAAYDSDSAARQRLVTQVREACTQCGFFQLINHGISSKLQDEIMGQASELFNLPIDVKEQYSKDIGGFNRGYERLRAQNFEKKTEGDLKEGFYFGRDLPLDDPNVAAKKFGQGLNKYPVEVSDPKLLRNTIDSYHQALSDLAKAILGILAESLDLDQSWFDSYCQDPVAVLRLLHYPPQAPDASALERGIGAHTDFGAITLLLQDEVGGLQIWDRSTSGWVDVQPRRHAYVVNLGNMMMRWTNDNYLSNLHRVINKSGRERYSVPFFFSGNPDFTVECLPSCRDPGTGRGKYDPITVGEWMTGRYADTYGTDGGGGKGKGMVELSVAEATAATA